MLLLSSALERKGSSCFGPPGADAHPDHFRSDLSAGGGAARAAGGNDTNYNIYIIKNGTRRMAAASGSACDCKIVRKVVGFGRIRRGIISQC